MQDAGEAGTARWGPEGDAEPTGPAEDRGETGGLLCGEGVCVARAGLGCGGRLCGAGGVELWRRAGG